MVERKSKISNESVSVFWREYLQKMQATLPKVQFDTWLQALDLVLSKDGITLIAPNVFKQNWAKKHYIKGLVMMAKQYFDDPDLEIPCVSFQEEAVTSKAHASREETLKPIAKQDKATTAVSSPVELSNKEANGNLKEGNLVSDYTFENFVSGKANQLAYAAAQRVADVSDYNPLFIYGGPGLGKTHLLHAIGHYICQERPQLKVALIHGETYVRHVVQAYQGKNFDSLKRQYQDVDVLLVDDIQFIAGKSRTQEEFFFTYEALKNSGRTMVLTCDTFPARINNMEERLRSRLGSGLTVTIEPPELEMRVGILMRKAAAYNLQLPEKVAFFIARYLRSNVRDLEGALKNLAVNSTLTRNTNICIDTVKDVLRERLAFGSKEIEVSDIQKSVANFFHLRVVDLLGKSRSASVTRPRQVAMYLAKEMTQVSLVEIGGSFNRDHTTVMHAVRQITAKRKLDKKLSGDIEIIKQSLRDGESAD